jgi:hypothetical protein
MLIGLTGKKRSGKDTVYQIINSISSNDPNMIVKRIAFADKVKEAASIILNISPAYLELHKDNSNLVIKLERGDLWLDLSLRNIIQRIGTEVGRDLFGKNFWIDQVLPLDFDHSNQLVIVTDVRFENEAQRVIDLGGVIWEVQRPDNNYKDDHSSETGISKGYINHIIINRNSLQNLEREIRIAMYAYTSDLLYKKKTEKLGIKNAV